MATRKEKTVEEYLEGRTPERKERTKKLKEKVLTMVPTIVQGSHLTVLTFPDGRVELKWDDAALLKDVQKALTEYENSVKVTTTKTKRKKKDEA
jgi:hypothetical protein